MRIHRQGMLADVGVVGQAPGPGGGRPPLPRPQLLHPLAAPLRAHRHRPHRHGLASLEPAPEPGLEVGVDVEEVGPGEPAAAPSLQVTVEETLEHPLTLPLPGEAARTSVLEVSYRDEPFLRVRVHQLLALLDTLSGVSRIVVCVREVLRVRVKTVFVCFGKISHRLDPVLVSNPDSGDALEPASQVCSHMFLIPLRGSCWRTAGDDLRTGG